MKKKRNNSNSNEPNADQKKTKVYSSSVVNEDDEGGTQESILSDELKRELQSSLGCDEDFLRYLFFFFCFKVLLRDRDEMAIR